MKEFIKDLFSLMEKEKEHYSDKKTQVKGEPKTPSALRKFLVRKTSIASKDYEHSGERRSALRDKLSGIMTKEPSLPPAVRKKKAQQRPDKELMGRVGSKTGSLSKKTGLRSIFSKAKTY